MSKTYNEEQIKEMLPHRDPFLFVEKLEILEDGTEGIGYKSITMKQDFFKGHFPNNPIMPGVLQIESMAQVAGCVVIENMPNYKNEKKGVFFMSVDGVKFRKPVVPDTMLKMHVKKIKERGKVFVFEGKAYIGEDLCSEATFTAMITG